MPGSKLLELTGELEGVDDSREMVQTGRIDQVSQYCESDVVNKADIVGSMPLLIQIKPVCL